MYKGTAPTLSKTRAKPSDAGTYRCQLNTVNNSPATIIRYHVRGQCGGALREVWDSGVRGWERPASGVCVGK